MKRNGRVRLCVSVLGVLVVGMATAVLAHHSMSAKYDVGRTITIEGTLTEVAWTNPHSYLFLDGKPVDRPDAPVQNWIIEAPSPVRMVKIGWQKDAFKAGDKARITGYPRRDGKPEMAFTGISDDRGHNFQVPSRLPYGEAGPSAQPSGAR